MLELAKKLSISNGNNKMGKIPSVSLPPVVTCRKGAPCAKWGACYALKQMRYPNVKNAYYNNLELFNENPENYFAQLNAALMINRFFRVHVSGDIVSADYLNRLVKVVENNPHCCVLMFTKKFEIVNAYIDNGGKIPENFKIIFSNWGTWKCENPHNLPVTEVIFKDTEIGENWKICGGNCENCACRGVGCWEIKNGEILAFYKH